MNKFIYLIFILLFSWFLTSCNTTKKASKQKIQTIEIIKDKIITVPAIRIDTIINFKTDSIFVVSNDTIRVETLVTKDKIIQHIETKPIYIKTTDTIRITDNQEITTIKKNKSNKIKIIVYLVLTAILILGCKLVKKRINKFKL